MVVTRGREVRERGRHWGEKLQLRRMNGYKDLMHSAVTIVNNTALCTRNLLKEYISRHSHHTTKE